MWHSDFLGHPIGQGRICIKNTASRFQVMLVEVLDEEENSLQHLDPDGRLAKSFISVTFLSHRLCAGS